MRDAARKMKGTPGAGPPVRNAEGWRSTFERHRKGGGYVTRKMRRLAVVPAARFVVPQFNGCPTGIDYRIEADYWSEIAVSGNNK